MTSQAVIIKEIIYFDALTLVKMCNYFLNRNDVINVIVSSYENIGKIIKGIIPVTTDYTMVRINDYELFNRFYNCDVDNVVDAMKLKGLPLYYNDWK